MAMKIFKIPDQCQICRDPIKLYEPYYTLFTKKSLVGLKGGVIDKTVLCPRCYASYKDFLTEQTVHENHKKHMEDIKK